MVTPHLGRRGEDTEQTATAETWAAIKTARHSPPSERAGTSRTHASLNAVALLLRVPLPGLPSAPLPEPLARRLATFLCIAPLPAAFCLEVKVVLR